MDTKNGKMTGSSERVDDVTVVAEISEFSSSLPAEFLREKMSRRDMPLREFMRFMLTSDVIKRDISFLVKGEDGNAEKIYAHKSVLRPKSEFFAALASDRWDQEEINLTNTKFFAEDFRVFIEFLYTNDVKLNLRNAPILYYMGDLYQIDEMKKRCREFFCDELTDDNVFVIFDIIFRCGDFDEKIMHEVLDRIWGLGEKVFEKPEFLELEKEKLRFIFRKRNMWFSSDYKILRFYLRWVKKKQGDEMLCNHLALEEQMFEILGSGGMIRLPKFTDPNIQNKLTSFDDPRSEFEISRFLSRAGGKRWVYRPGRYDRVSFRVSRTIIITGIGLYSLHKTMLQENMVEGKRKRPRYTEKHYDIEIKIHIHGFQHREISRCTVEVEEEKISFENLKVNLKEPAYIYPDQWYTIAVQIKGPDTYYGMNGKAQLLTMCGKIPVVVEFKDASSSDGDAKLANPTGMPTGQIPEIYFKLTPADSNDELQVL